MTIEEKSISNFFNDKFPLLSLETSGRVFSASLFLSSQNYIETNIKIERSQSDFIFTALEKLFNLAQVNVFDLKAIILSNGPGSFTGLRVGSAAAKGIAFAKNLPIITIDTFDALAYQICSNWKDLKQFYVLQNSGRLETIVAKYYRDNSDEIRNSIEKKVYKSIDLIDLLEKDIFKFYYSQSFKDMMSVEIKGAINIDILHSKYVAEYAFLYFNESKMLSDAFNSEPFYIKEFIPRSRQ